MQDISIHMEYTSAHSHTHTYNIIASNDNNNIWTISVLPETRDCRSPNKMILECLRCIEHTAASWIVMHCIALRSNRYCLSDTRWLTMSMCALVCVWASDCCIIVIIINSHNNGIKWTDSPWVTGYRVNLLERRECRCVSATCANADTVWFVVAAAHNANYIQSQTV